jgi:hypothetical protein
MQTKTRTSTTPSENGSLYVLAFTIVVSNIAVFLGATHYGLG